MAEFETFTYTYSRIPIRLPYNHIHPKADEARRLSRQWADEYMRCFFASEVDYVNAIEDDCDGCALIIHADALFERVVTICNIYHLFGGIDNVIDNIPYEQRHEFADVIKRGLEAHHAGWDKSLKEYTPQMRAMDSCSEQFTAFLSPAQVKTWYKGLADYADGYDTEDRFRATNTRPETVQEVIQYRRKQAPRFLLPMLVEVGNGLDVSKELEECSALDGAREVSCRYCMLDNDFHSYRKELVWGDHLTNTMHLQRLEHRCSLQEAVDRQIALIQEQERQFYRECDNVRAFYGEAIPPHVVAYMDALQYFMMGMNTFGFTSPRYNGLKSNWDDHWEGRVVMYRDRTEYHRL